MKMKTMGGVQAAPTLIFLTALFFAYEHVLADARVIRYLTGYAADVSPPLFGPALNLGGGSTDVDAALQWMIDQTRGCSDCEIKIDVVIIRARGANGYNAFIYGMNGVDSVETLVIGSRNAAEQSDVDRTVRNAEVVFFAGGDQCKYVRNYKGTKLETAVESVYARGGAIGGTSAGCAIMGTTVFDACNDTAYSDRVLQNPYDKTVSLTRDLFEWTHMANTITDQHFAQRNRLGRLLTFMAREIQDENAKQILGVAVNERTSVVIDKNGLAKVLGEGPAYFILADHMPQICKPGTPLTYEGYKIWKIPSLSTFDLKDRPTSGYYLRSVINGKFSENPY